MRSARVGACSQPRARPGLQGARRERVRVVGTAVGDDNSLSDDAQGLLNDRVTVSNRPAGRRSAVRERLKTYLANNTCTHDAVRFVTLPRDSNNILNCNQRSHASPILKCIGRQTAHWWGYIAMDVKYLNDVT